MPTSSIVVTGLPGIRAEITATPRHVFRGGPVAYLPGGGVIDGTLSRDSGNTGDTDRLRAGLLMGKVTSSGKYAPSILGVTDAAYSGGTTLDVTAACAVEIVRRIGTTGTFKIIGPPTAGGTVATATVTYSAVNQTNGNVTITALGSNFISGSFIAPTDGSDDPVSLIADGYPIKVTDYSGASQDQEWPQIPIRGTIESGQIINWPSDTSLQAWIVSRLNESGAGDFTFTHLF